MERKYFTGSMPLLTLSHAFRTCVGAEAFTFTTIFKKCDVYLAQEGRNVVS